MPHTNESEAQPGTGLKIQASLIGKLNLADYENAVPALRELSIVNDADTIQEDLVLSMSSEPSFFKPKQWHIQAVGPQQRCHLGRLDLQLDGPLLTRLTEAEIARVKFEVRRPGAGDAALASFEHDVELLPRNHWGGLSHLPEMIAAFVQPNDPAVDKILKKAAQLLRDNGKSPALNGYQDGSKHAWEILAAIWGAVVAEQLDYAVPPASFERAGQKVRSPAQIIESGLGTCLDLALLFAAAAEQAGLNPLLVFTTGHAFTGCWLRPEDFGTPVIDDPTALRKRIRLEELILFETTIVTEQPAPPFSRAVGMGVQQIAEDAASPFEAAVDIRRARMHKIRPLAAGEVPAPRQAAAEPPATTQAAVLEDAPDLPEATPSASAGVDPRALSPVGRVERWQRKLLDLSLRNSLLNFRKSKRSIVFDAPDPGKLEDALAEGKALKLLPRPVLMEGSDPRSRSIHEARAHEDLRNQHALDALAKGEVFAGAGAEELEAALVELYRAARSSLEEGGANTLFLALGFLVWSPPGKAQTCRAPLILIPVTLNRRSVRSGFTLSLHEDEPLLNPTLVEMLRQDFRLDLGIPEGELPKDDSGLDVKGIWARVLEAIKDIKGWEVVSDVLLSTFSFAKHLMWKDLVHRTDQLRENPVVRHLIDTPRDNYLPRAPFADSRRLDAECEPTETFCPLPADSSQLAAIMSAARGNDFVLIGPPGTGKSQTIANLIVHCIASGKRVLFVAEKMAALDVVSRRLRDVGLGQFCLELHSSKAKKSAVLAALGAAWEAQGAADREKWHSEAQRLKKLRDSLNLYVERLHRPHPNGLTVHLALGNVVAGASVPVVDLSWTDPSLHDSQRMEALRSAAAKLDVHASAFGLEELSRTPLISLDQTNWTPLWQTEFLGAVKQVREAAANAREAFRNLLDATGLPCCQLTVSERSAMVALSRVLPACVGRNWGFATRTDASTSIAELKSAIALLDKHRALSAEITSPWPANVVSACRSGLRLIQERENLLSGLPAPWPPSVREQLQHGIQLLEEIPRAEAQLSVRYDTSAAALNFCVLASEWHKAEQSAWPFSWLGKRRVKAALAPRVLGVGRPEIKNDLAILHRLENIRSEVSGIDLRMLPVEVWSGLRTSVEIARAALKLQTGLTSVRDGRTWEPEGVELVASGLCGPGLKQTFDQLERLGAVEDELRRLEWLFAATDGIWAGAATKREALSAALEFCDEWKTGALTRPHHGVAVGECGVHLQKQFQLLRQRARIEAEIASFRPLSGKTAGLWRGLETNLEDAASVIEFAGVITAVVPAIAHTEADNSDLRAALERLCAPGAASSAKIREAGEGFSDGVSNLTRAITQMAQIGCFTDRVRRDFESAGLEDLEQRCQAIATAAPRLQKWCSWRHIRAEAVALGLGPLALAIEKGTIRAGEVRQAFETNYSRWWLDHAVSADEVLRNFVSAEHEQRIIDFRAVDDRYTALTRDFVKAKLCAAVPSAAVENPGPEWGILRRELNKKKRHMPLRELMGRIPSVITSLTPCLLMSPLSIAQYLAVSAATFDLVVFDEASQITVWDAIGAIARGKQVIMVGDPKQLPPTNFFNKADVEDDSDDVPEDLESILDECIGANLPRIQLSWHYRSRHESLIAFSNHRYYDGALITFPSPTTNDRAVSFHYVRGVYERGGARINQVEAKAVVADIVAKLKSRTFARSGHSIGVVTFNAEQQGLIEDLLDEERRRDPSIEPFFSDDRIEPVFVKNLESVQGDERDVMYFSVTYGPDWTGKATMNFGPMNNDGGERRLNVAITRARRELRVFSSMRPEDFDLSKTQATGVAELKYFLEFAERGPRAFVDSTPGSLGGFDSPFEQYVAEALTSRGWTVHTQIGASAFRIDLGIVHPDAPGIYLAGIECDGATYHRSATARDRDKLREQVLRELGWDILRVWSTDWWIDRETTLNKLDADLRCLLEESRRNRAEKTATEIAPEPEVLRAEESYPVEDLSEAEEIFAAEDSTEEDEPLEALAVAETAGGEYRQSLVRQSPIEARNPESYILDGIQADPDAFYERSYDATLNRMIAAVVEKEGPVLDEVLARRIARAHGWQRTGSRITERVTRIASRSFKRTKETVGTFFWPSSLEPGQKLAFRPNTERTVDEICIQELIAVAASVLATGAAGEEAISAMAREVGLQRPRAPSRRRLETALRRARTVV